MTKTSFSSYQCAFSRWQQSCQVYEKKIVHKYPNPVSSFRSKLHRSARKGPYALRPISQHSPQGCPRNSTNVCLVEHWSFPTSDGGTSAASFLHSSFLQAIDTVMLQPVHVRKFLKPLNASALPSCKSDVMSAVLASLSDSSFPRTPAVDPRSIQDSTFCSRFVEFVRMTACVICVSVWKASYCTASVTASTFMAELEVRSKTRRHQTYFFFLSLSPLPPPPPPTPSQITELR